MHIDQAKLLSFTDLQRHAGALQPETRMFIDGGLCDALSGKRFETVNPATSEVIASVPSADVDDVDRAVRSARRSFRSGIWSRLEPRARMEVLYRFAY
jgi:acyl-CoA reductase-like NAD-dependent aldehyde dehydrogenase